ncbi:MAG: TetR/AcrR family transcriptional regulator [Gammaproteobacteria bacterium]|nr:TetR/AcrR family transcriptional regulator [Gammaproteobacteria bacterium]MYB37272.1 TetR/AcrR family transcriptional regulator [Gammaproteobacteria bacterium]
MSSAAEPTTHQPRRNARHRSNRLAIVEAAIAALSVNRGATMSEIAARAGVGRATLHRHFHTRDELVRAIGAQCVEEMNAAVQAVDAADAPPTERLRAMFNAVIPLGDRYSFLAFETADDEVVRASYRTQLRWTEALAEELKATGDIASDVPTRWVVGQVDQLVWTGWKAVADGYVTGDEASELACRTLIDGLKQPSEGAVGRILGRRGRAPVVAQERIRAARLNDRP